MACFLVPVAEAVVTTVIAKAKKSKDGNLETVEMTNEKGDLEPITRIPFSRKLKWLNNMLWGGSALLAFEHIWHGEVVPWFPFLTAAGDAAEASVMLNEMATVGVTMAVLVTAIWGIMVLVTNSMEKKELKAQSAAN